MADNEVRCAEHGAATRLTCVTCGRPLCPRCLVQTSVGFKCRSDARGPRIVRASDLPDPRQAPGRRSSFTYAPLVVMLTLPLLVPLVLRVFATSAGVVQPVLITLVATCLTVVLVVVLRRRRW